VFATDTGYIKTMANSNTQHDKDKTMKADLMTAAIINGMNAHNAEIKECTDAGTVTLTDYCGNVYTLHVWVRADLTLKYLLSCRNVPNAVGNVYRAPLPVRADSFDSPADMMDAIAKTRNVAETTYYTLSPASREWQAELDADC